MKTVTAIAPVNIAVIKYWGKRDEELVLPLNGSISATLDSDYMCAKTTVAMDETFEKDRLWLNGMEEEELNTRFRRVLKEVRMRANKNESDFNLNWKIHICSINNFPTAAGLASSAAGFACLVFALCKLLNVDGNCSDIARLGSGSACRSMFGGWVEWEMGHKGDGSDSVAKQLASANHWRDMAVVIVVVNRQQKIISSTAGMQLSTQTSHLLHHRAAKMVPVSLEKMKGYVDCMDFQGFAELMMKDSNNLHATLLDTYPPIHYLSPTSHHVIRLVHAVNEFYGRVVLGYTFDAGPNACLFILKKDLDLILSLLSYFYPPIGEGKFITGIDTDIDDYKIDPLLLEWLERKMKRLQGSVCNVINTQVGDGPKLLSDSDALIDESTGLPL